MKQLEPPESWSEEKLGAFVTDAKNGLHNIDEAKSKTGHQQLVYDGTVRRKWQLDTSMEGALNGLDEYLEDIQDTQVMDPEFAYTEEQAEVDYHHQLPADSLHPNKQFENSSAIDKQLQNFHQEAMCKGLLTGGRAKYSRLTGICVGAENGVASQNAGEYTDRLQKVKKAREGESIKDVQPDDGTRTYPNGADFDDDSSSIWSAAERRANAEATRGSALFKAQSKAVWEAEKGTVGNVAMQKTSEAESAARSNKDLGMLRLMAGDQSAMSDMAGVPPGVM